MYKFRKILLTVMVLFIVGCAYNSFLNFKDHCKNFEENFKFYADKNFRLIFLRKSFSRKDIISIFGGPGVEYDGGERYTLIKKGGESIEVSMFYRNKMLYEFLVNNDAYYFPNDLIIKSFENFGNGKTSLREHSISFELPGGIQKEYLNMFFGKPDEVGEMHEDYRFGIKGKTGILPSRVLIKIYYSQNLEPVKCKIYLDNINFF